MDEEKVGDALEQICYQLDRIATALEHQAAGTAPDDAVAARERKRREAVLARRRKLAG